MSVGDFQRRIEDIYFKKDSDRGVERTFLWFTEEVGELAEAIRLGDRAMLEEEFADVLAWLSTLASLTKIDLDAAVEAKYGRGCPKCSAIPCNCSEPTTTG